MSGENTETLHLTKLERQNIGEYSCSSRNELGENHSSTITLRVQCKLEGMRRRCAIGANIIPIAVIRFIFVRIFMGLFCRCVRLQPFFSFFEQMHHAANRALNNHPLVQ